MIAWLALALALLGLALWLAAALVGLALWRKAKPIVEPYLLAFGMVSAEPEAPATDVVEPDTDARRCAYVGPSGARCLLLDGHSWSDDPHSHQFDRDPLLR